MSVAATILGSVVGKKVIDKILDVVEKRIPMTKDQKTQLEADLALTEVEGIKARTEYVKSLGTKVRDSIIPLLLFGFFLMHIGVFLSDLINANLGKEMPIIYISPEYTKVCIAIIGFLFPYKGFQIYSDNKK